jgi:hypothetical protein
MSGSHNAAFSQDHREIPVRMGWVQEAVMEGVSASTFHLKFERVV